MRKGKFTAVEFSSIFIIFVVVIVVLASPIIHFNTKETVRNVEVLEKERVVDKDSSKYLIFTDREVFENVDSLWELKFDSSDYYRNIRVGQICNFDVVGFRIPFLSSYRNIVDYNCKDKILTENQSDFAQ